MTSDKNSSFPVFPMPMRGVLLLCGMYTFAIGAFFRYFGKDLIKWLSMNAAFSTEISSNTLGSIGMVLGFLIFLSAFYPISWNYLILVGILGKITLATWFVIGFMPELDWNKRTIFHLVFNELIWLIPLGFIFFRSIKVKKYLDSIKDN
ncbi:hypothetical protein A33Q_4099 [Indibacter alkaliphilus LW1]|uniref:DUF4345 domain-containing protein n=1 Tax=Indibacter alkaliphilus (strain CCUG 57479 / KCTC 22604 / LW1) TaxID=1189612 RepID=S2DJ77_INDAL|nr:hypothetical protein [Indibacter alkaliphilus]EOZ92006.1 hypothetical protein A33Q_4099 [Indibacter alkaliphilus LW1]